MQYCLYQYGSNYTKKRRATAIRHQGSPQAHLQNGVTPRISQVLNVGFNAHVHFEVVILMTLSKYIKKLSIISGLCNCIKNLSHNKNNYYILLYRLLNKISKLFSPSLYFNLFICCNFTKQLK